MSVDYDNTLKAARLNAGRALVAGGTLEIATDAGFGTIIATWTLDGTAGSVALGVWTLAFTSAAVVAATDGTAASARIKDSGSTVRISGLTVGTSGTDVVFDNNIITSGQNVTITSATINHA